MATEEMLQEVQAVRACLGRKILPEDVTLQLGNLAANYLSTANLGGFPFLSSVQAALRNIGHISAAQAAGVLNCMAAQAAQQERTQVSIRHEPVPNGTYTVVFPDGDYVTLRLAPDWRPEHKEHQVAKYLAGPDNDADYAGFAFVEGRSFRVWSRFAGKSRQIEALKVLLQGDSWRNAGEAYALKSGNCFKCGRRLTTPVSLNRGLGPICAERQTEAQS